MFAQFLATPPCVNKASESNDLPYLNVRLRSKNGLDVVSVSVSVSVSASAGWMDGLI